MATKKINFYMKYATQNLILAMDDHSLFCKVISETVEGISYRVEMDEETMTAKSCSCPARGACKHLTIANTLQYKVVAPVVEETPVAEPTITEVECKQWYVVNHAHQVWCQDGTWMCASGVEFVEMVKAHLGIQDEPQAAQVKEVVPPIAMELPEELQGYRKTAKVGKPGSVELAYKGNLNGNRGFQLMKVS